MGVALTLPLVSNVWHKIYEKQCQLLIDMPVAALAPVSQNEAVLDAEEPGYPVHLQAIPP